MLKLPAVPAELDQPLPKMRLVDYAHFSEFCLRSNSLLTAANCMRKRTDETTMTRPFRLEPCEAPAAGTLHRAAR